MSDQNQAPPENGIPEEGDIEFEQQNIAQEEKPAHSPKILEPSIIRKNDDKSETVPLWLITFTDVMALMLTFFVLLYAMASPEEKKWESISVSLSSNFSKDYSRPMNAGSQDVVNIDRISKSKALDLRYLKTIMTTLLKEKGLENVLVFPNGRSLVISLPSEVLFDSASSEINVDGKKTLFSLSGVLNRIKNRVEIIGHTDPRPITGTADGYTTNRELSLARAASVASILSEMGYRKDMTIRGLSSARFDELPQNIPEEKAYDLSRRVDIVIMDDDGYKGGLQSY